MSAPTQPLIEAGHQYIRSLDLNPGEQAVLRANCVEHRRYGAGRPYEVKSSVFADTREVCAVLRMPERERAS